MEEKKKSDTPDYECIAAQIIKTLHNSGVTYREAETAIEYVCCKLSEQPVQGVD